MPTALLAILIVAGLLVVTVCGILGATVSKVTPTKPEDSDESNQ